MGKIRSWEERFVRSRYWQSGARTHWGSLALRESRRRSQFAFSVTSENDSSSDEAEFHFALFRNHILIPGRIPNDIDLSLRDTGDLDDL